MQTMMKWKKDGDQFVALGMRGEYRITPWGTSNGTDFLVRVTAPSNSTEPKLTLGSEFTLAAAKLLCEAHEEHLT